MDPRRPAGRHLVAVLAVCLAASGALAAQQFRSGVDLVRLPVVVTGKDRLLVRGLTPADFEILEDGAPQTMAAFAEGALGDSVPLHLGLMLDTSSSMEQDVRAAAGAAIQFVSALDEAASVTFVDFDANVRTGRFTPASYPQLFERIRQVKTAGMTALYDALAIYLNGTKDRPGQHVLLMYTDGGDSSSRLTYDQILRLVRGSNVLVYALGYLEHQTSSVRGALQIRLGSLARETGGDAYFPASVRELHGIYARILDELGSRYTLGYVSSNPVADGRFRKVQVRLATPALKSAKVRTRSGYMAPTPSGR